MSPLVTSGWWAKQPHPAAELSASCSRAWHGDISSCFIGFRSEGIRRILAQSSARFTRLRQAVV